MKLIAIASLVAVLGSAGCLVEQRCSRNDDCPGGQRCSLGRCVVADLGTTRPDLGTKKIKCPPDMVKVADAFCVDIYEASRPDATQSSGGAKTGAAISRKGVIPWLVSGNEEATAACQAAGKRLCTPTEWQTACQGSQKQVYGYGNTYEPKTCNGIDTFGPWQDYKFKLMPTGSFPGCKNDWGAFDMNGNVWEHVKDGSALNVRGGAFNCSDSRELHKCTYIPGWRPSALGFRCCSDGTPVDQDAGPRPDLPALPDLDPDTAPDLPVADLPGPDLRPADLLPSDAASSE